MNDSDYEKMVLMGTGRLARDQGWLDKLAIEGHKKEEVEAKAKYEKEHPSPRSQREIELEAREFDLKLFGRRHMEKYARPINEDKLSVPSDSPAVRVLQEHSAVEPCRTPDGRLRLQNHGACPQRQVLQLL
jgi:hypothetical protein